MYVSERYTVLAGMCHWIGVLFLALQPRGALKKVLYGEAPPQALTPYPFIYHSHRNCTPFVYLLLKKGTPFIYLKDMA